ncbi:hypothetical protein [Lysobacter gummosus]
MSLSNPSTYPPTLTSIPPLPRPTTSTPPSPPSRYSFVSLN